jgi:hypothetical protein
MLILKPKKVRLLGKTRTCIQAWKLLRRRADGTLGPLFINRKLVIVPGKWLRAEDHPTKGYAHRPGWHAAPSAHAPHLSVKGRVWCKVWLQNWKQLVRPAVQGGAWYLAEEMLVEPQ